MLPERTRYALVGLGRWGPNHARVVAENPEARLVAVCDLDEKALDKFRAIHPHVRTTSDVTEIAAADDIDAVIIATPAITHEKIARECMLGNKDLLIEKPITTDSASAVRLSRLAEERERVLMVGHTFEYNATLTALRRLVHAQSIGRLLYMHASRTGLGPIRHDVNALWDLAPHDTAMFVGVARALPTRVSAFGRSYLQPDVEDVVFLNFEFPDGRFANAHVSWLGPLKKRELTVVGDAKMAVFDDTSNLERLKIFDKGVQLPAQHSYGEYRLQVRDGDILSPAVDTTEPLKLQFAHFHDCVRTRARPITDGWFGSAIVRILEAAQESLKADGTPTRIEYGEIGEHWRASA